MAEAVYRHGEVTAYLDYTPASGNIAAGEVVLLGNLTGLCNGIAHLNITNAVLGALAIGGGVYDVTMLENIAAYSKVYWDNTNNKVTNTSTNMSPFGVLLEGGTGANTVVECFHHPYT
jgi:hypothetical protein